MTIRPLQEATFLTGVNLTADVTVALFGVACWLFLAWASGRGFPLGRRGHLVRLLHSTNPALSPANGITQPG
jgi:hypothetical protein